MIDKMGAISDYFEESGDDVCFWSWDLRGMRECCDARVLLSSREREKKRREGGFDK